MSHKISEETFIKFLNSKEETLIIGRMIELDSYFTFLTGKPTWIKNSYFYATKSYRVWLEPQYETIKNTLKPWWEKWAKTHHLKAFWGAPGSPGIGFLRMGHISSTEQLEGKSDR